MYRYHTSPAIKTNARASHVIFAARRQLLVVIGRVLEQFRFLTYGPGDLTRAKFIVDVECRWFERLRGLATSIDRLRTRGAARWRGVRGIELIGVDEDRRGQTRTSLVVLVIDGFEAKSVLPVARTTPAVGKEKLVDGLHLDGRAELERARIAVMDERAIVFGAQRRVHVARGELFGAWREIDLIGRGSQWAAVP